MTTREEARFIEFLKRNKVLGRKECAARGVTNYGIPFSRAESIIAAQLEAGVLTKVRQPNGSGRPKEIITAA